MKQFAGIFHPSARNVEHIGWRDKSQCLHLGWIWMLEITNELRMTKQGVSVYRQQNVQLWRKFISQTQQRVKQHIERTAMSYVGLKIAEKILFFSFFSCHRLQKSGREGRGGRGEGKGTKLREKVGLETFAGLSRFVHLLIDVMNSFCVWIYCCRRRSKLCTLSFGVGGGGWNILIPFFVELKCFSWRRMWARLRTCKVPT